MKRIHIAAMLAALLCMVGCTASKAIEEMPATEFSSAGNVETAPSEDELIAELMKKKPVINKSDKTDPQVITSLETDKKETASVKTSESGSSAKQDPVQQQPSSDPVQTVVSEPAYEPEPVYQEPDPEPVPEPTPPPAPPQACPGGVNPDLGCEVVLDSNYYRETFYSYGDAMAKGQYYMDEVMYIGDIEITNYSVQEVYRNDHSIAFYGLNLWSSGSLIQ